MKFTRNPNVDWRNVQKTIDYLQEFVRNDRFTMTSYVSLGFDRQGFDEQQKDVTKVKDFCQTAGCIAGWAWSQNHQEQLDAAFLVHVSELLNSDEDSCVRDVDTILQHLFGFNDNPPVSDYFGWAREYFGLSQAQAQELFVCTHEAGTETCWTRHKYELFGSCQAYDPCSYSDWEEGYCEHEVELSWIERPEAIAMLQGLVAGTFQFGCDVAEYEEALSEFNINLIAIRRSINILNEFDIDVDLLAEYNKIGD